MLAGPGREGEVQPAAGDLPEEGPATRDQAGGGGRRACAGGRLAAAGEAVRPTLKELLLSDRGAWELDRPLTWRAAAARAPTPS